MEPEPVDTTVTNNLYYYRDDYNSPKSIQDLTHKLARYNGGDLWLDYLKDHEIEEIRRALMARPPLKKVAIITLSKFIKLNGLQPTIIDPILALFTKCIEHRINIHSLFDEFSPLEYFIEKYGSFHGVLRWVIDRASDDIEASSARWIHKLLSHRGLGFRPQVLVASAEHVPPLIKLIHEYHGSELRYVAEGEGRLREVIIPRIDKYNADIQTAIMEKARDGSELTEEDQAILHEAQEIIAKIESWALTRI